MPWTWQSSSIDAVDANQHKVRHCMAQQALANSHNMIRMLWTQLLSVRYFSSWDIQGPFQQLRRNQLSQFCGKQINTDAIFRQRNYQSWFVQNHPQPTPFVGLCTSSFVHTDVVQLGRIPWQAGNKPNPAAPRQSSDVTLKYVEYL